MNASEFKRLLEVISQYTIARHGIDGDSVVLTLAHKHTDCLARELCGVPAGAIRTAPASSCCGSSGCC